MISRIVDVTNECHVIRGDDLADVLESASVFVRVLAKIYQVVDVTTLIDNDGESVVCIYYYDTSKEVA